MDIEVRQATTIRAFNILGLDPITIMMEDLEPSKGRITISCFDRSWTAYWGAMGKHTVGEFFAFCDEHYLASNLCRNLRDRVVDLDAVQSEARRLVIEERRARDITQDEARSLFDDIENELLDEGSIAAGLARRIFGDDWHCHLPQKENPEYAYLCRVIKGAQAAIDQFLESQESVEQESTHSASRPRG